MNVHVSRPLSIFLICCVLCSGLLLACGSDGDKITLGKLDPERGYIQNSTRYTLEVNIIGVKIIELPPYSRVREYLQESKEYRFDVTVTDDTGTRISQFEGKFYVDSEGYDHEVDGTRCSWYLEFLSEVQAGVRTYS